MPRIDVEYSALRKTIEDIKDYNGTQERLMLQADFDIKSMLCVGWMGADAKEFDQKWAGVNDENSEARQLCYSLIELYRNIKICIKDYQEAQASAIYRASQLC